MNGSNILIATVGLPRSGKTTWARGYATRFNTPIVSPDAIRYALHGERYIQAAEPHVWAIAHTMVSALFIAGHGAVILDACNVSEKRRKEWMSPDWITKFKVIDAGLTVCLERANLENDVYVVPIIERMAARYEPLADDALRLA